MAALSNAVAINLQSSGAAQEIKASGGMRTTPLTQLCNPDSPLPHPLQAKLRSIVAQQLLRSSAAPSGAEEDDGQDRESSEASLEDCIVFDYLRQSLCTFTLPVFVAERPGSCGSDSLAALGALSSQLEQTAKRTKSSAGDCAPSTPVLRQLLHVIQRELAGDGPVDLSALRDGATQSSSLAKKLAEADARVTGAVEVAELRASFAAQLEAYQRAADERALAEVESRLASLRVSEIARVRAEERQRFETELSQVRAAGREGGRPAWLCLVECSPLWCGGRRFAAASTRTAREKLRQPGLKSTASWTPCDGRARPPHLRRPTCVDGS